MSQTKYPNINFGALLEAMRIAKGRFHYIIDDEPYCVIAVYLNLCGIDIQELKNKNCTPMIFKHLKMKIGDLFSDEELSFLHDIQTIWDEYESKIEARDRCFSKIKGLIWS